MIRPHAWLLAATLLGTSAAAPSPTPLHIVYLGLATPRPHPSTMLEPPPADEAIQGARLAVADDTTTGRFLGQSFALDEFTAPTDDAILARFDQALAAGSHLFVADLPAALLGKLADRPGAAKSLILDATTRDDALRGRDCRAGVLHMLPDRAMLTDALMQYLVAKNWLRILLLAGTTAPDKLYAAAVRASAAKFQITLRDDRSWTFNPAAQQADTGHYQVNDEVAKATQGVSYDVLVVADEAGSFGPYLTYRTDTPRPVAGTQGLVASAWSPIMDEYASTQLQLRFHRQAHRWMTDRDYGGWLAVRAIGEAATRTGTTEPARLIDFLHGPDFAMSGYKGPPFSFRPWDGQLRQPVLLADERSLVSVSPQPGFLHQNNDLDSLGADQPETECKK